MTLVRPMFPPRGDTSRRNFIAQAAGVAAGSAALAVATVAPAPAIAAPGAVPEASKASPAFTAAVRSLDAAHGSIEAARRSQNFSALIDAENHFRAARFAVAKIEPRDEYERRLMAAAIGGAA